eukprot:15443765-Alexandrium_andersonii.AAC.1
MCPPALHALLQQHMQRGDWRDAIQRGLMVVYCRCDQFRELGPPEQDNMATWIAAIQEFPAWWKR